MTENEIDVLSLGPGFALAPLNKDKVKDEVKIRLAESAVKARHKDCIEEYHSCQTLDQFVRSAAPFQKLTYCAPAEVNTPGEAQVKQLQQFIVKKLDDTTLRPNLTKQQSEGLKSLKQKSEDLHISVSDKCGEFVVSTTQDHHALTQLHIDLAAENYKPVPPSRVVRGTGRVVEIENPTDLQYQKHKNKLVKDMETRCNDLWKSIAYSRGFPEPLKRYLTTHRATMPTMYCTIKSHKVKQGTLAEKSLDEIKVRPIVSCVGSPTDKLAWLVSYICTPLLKFIPSHLNNLHDYLKRLRNLDNSHRIGLHFYSADVVSLYTNIDPRQTCDDLVNMLSEYWSDVNTLGLTLTDIKMILDLVFNNTYFCYNSRVYLQFLGLFMGLRPSPIGAIVRMWTFEKNSIYIDITYITCYGKYIDDIGDVRASLADAEDCLTKLAGADPDKRLEFEIDFPSEEKEFIPFLNAEIKINTDGSVSSRLFRKPQKKLITLHNHSHHPMAIKINTLRNSYREANLIASPDQRDYSLKLVDTLYINNGYSDPRSYLKGNISDSHGFRRSSNNKNIVKLPFISDKFTKELNAFISSKKLPFTIVYTRATTLRELFVSTRPLDRVICTRKDCKVCNRLDKYSCIVTGVVYKLVCKLCGEIYVGETGRTAYDRLSEHMNYTENPTRKSYKEQTLAQHMVTRHPDLKPDLEFEILFIERNTLLRKIKEAYCIRTLGPTLNEKKEMKSLEKFML